MRRGVIAAVLAVVVTVSGTLSVAPAQADPMSAQATNTNIVIDVANLVASLFNAFKGGSMSVEEATRQIKAAIDQAKTDIISHMDRLAAVEARSCASRHVIEFADIDRMTVDTLQAWAQNATGCVTTIDALIGAVTDKAAIDTLGLANDVVGPIALMARARAGFSIDGLRAVLAGTNNKILSGLEPSCVWKPGFNTPFHPFGHCEAYNGDSAACDNCPFSAMEGIKVQAMKNTSWVVARQVLPIYQN
jgi:hypothetical protein